MELVSTAAGPATASARERAPRSARPPAIARFTSALYSLTAVAIVVWAATFSPRGSKPGGAWERVAFFLPLFLYALGLALAMRRVRLRGDDGSALPASLAYGLVLFHALVGFLGSSLFALDALTGYPTNAEPRNGAVQVVSGVLMFLCWPATVLGWLAPLVMAARVSRTGALLAVASGGALWMLFLAMDAAYHVGL